MTKILLLLALLSFFQLQELQESEEDDGPGMSYSEEYLTTTSPRFDYFQPGGVGVFGQRKFKTNNKNKVQMLRNFDNMKNFNNTTAENEPSPLSSFFWTYAIPIGVLILFPTVIILLCKRCRDRSSGSLTPASVSETLVSIAVMLSVRKKDGTHRGEYATKYKRNKRAMEEVKLVDRVTKYEAIEEITEPSTSRQSTAPSGSFATADLSARLESGASTSDSTPRQARAGRRDLEEGEELEETPILHARRPSTRSQHSLPGSGSFNVADLDAHHIDSGPSTSNNTPVRQARETLQQDEDEEPEDQQEAGGLRRSKRISEVHSSSQR